MKFKIEVEIQELKNKMTHADYSLSVGSCFSDNIGNKLKRYQFQCVANPFGVLFNTHSITQNLTNSLADIQENESNFILHNNMWHAWNFHGQFSCENKKELEQRIQSIKTNVKQHLLKSKYLLITLGTSWVYSFKKTNTIVANCHKVPNTQFEKKLLSPENNYCMLKQFIEQLREKNSDITILFTISPIRHWKDGAFENSVSKSSLFTAVHSLINEYPHCHYFPAYEIIIDELRDYRFYKKDMLHPSEQAVEYVWELFSQALIHQNSLVANKELDKIFKLQEHKPIQTCATQQEQTRQILNQKIEHLIEQYPFLKKNLIKADD